MQKRVETESDMSIIFRRSGGVELSGKILSKYV